MVQCSNIESIAVCGNQGDEFIIVGQIGIKNRINLLIIIITPAPPTIISQKPDKQTCQMYSHLSEPTGFRLLPEALSNETQLVYDHNTVSPEQSNGQTVESLG